MGEHGDVDAIHDFLLCNKALKGGKPRPPPRTRRREPPQEELKIKQPIWSKLKKETRDAWVRESDENKDLIVAQFAGNSKAVVPATKNHNTTFAQHTILILLTVTDMILILLIIQKAHFSLLPIFLPCTILPTMRVMGRAFQKKRG